MYWSAEISIFSAAQPILPEPILQFSTEPDHRRSIFRARSAGNLNNLTLSNASNLTINNASAATPVIVKANLQIDPGCTLNDNGRIIDVRGNISNSGTHFKPVSGAGSIQLTGVANQVIVRQRIGEIQ